MHAAHGPSVYRLILVSFQTFITAKSEMYNVQQLTLMFSDEYRRTKGHANGSHRWQQTKINNTASPFELYTTYCLNITCICWFSVHMSDIKGSFQNEKRKIQKVSE
eukprot:TRINITY_DN62216_c0_g1_i12.p1 TRINITY_DN62216_c0_g1~~TRINITY_DN62216_c0_g1_i12.p1  ORF type:complete len:106 (-),score=2.51 TRINITY_DN62216_c0_g1_i12:270-587(-)